MPRLDLLVMQRRDLTETLSLARLLYTDDKTRDVDHDWFDRMKTFLNSLNVEIEVEKRRG